MIDSPNATRAAARKADARALDISTDRTDAATLAWLLDNGLPGDTGHGDTIDAPEAWGEWDEDRKVRWCRAVIRRRDENGLRTGRYAPDSLDAAYGLLHDGPAAESVIVARDTLMAAIRASDATDRATMRAVSDAMGAIVHQPTDPDSAAAAHRNRARAARAAVRGGLDSNGLPRGAAALVATALGVSRPTATRRLQRLRANLAPLRDGLRLAGRLRADARA